MNFIKLIIIVLLSLGNTAPAGCSQSETKVQAKTYNFEYCGTIQRMDEQTSNERVIIAIGDHPYRVITLEAENEQIENTLAGIKWPNHAYIGCVYSNKDIQQIHTSEIFIVEKIDLNGQTSGVTIGN